MRWKVTIVKTKYTRYYPYSYTIWFYEDSSDRAYSYGQKSLRRKKISGKFLKNLAWKFDRDRDEERVWYRGEDFKLVDIIKEYEVESD